jgi:DNA-binding NarL/FixJ family response regulator
LAQRSRPRRGEASPRPAEAREDAPTRANAGAPAEGQHENSVVILDAFPLWVAALAELANTGGLRAVGTATEPRVALGLIAELHPDLFVTGIDAEDGRIDLDTVREARRLKPDLKVLVISQRADRASIAEAFAAGAHVYALKNANPGDLAAGMRQIFTQSFFLPTYWDAPVATVQQPSESVGLTRREIEVLQLVANGHTNQVMGSMLWVTEQTIKFHLSNIYRKLKLSNRTEAALWAQVHGLLQMKEPVDEPVTEKVA